MEWKKIAMKDVSQVLLELQTSHSGLSSASAEERLRLSGSNTFDTNSFSLFEMVKRRFHSSFLYLLLGAGGLSYFLGDHIEAGLILVFIFLNIGLEMYQEYRGEKATKLLKQYLILHSRVRRGGEVIKIPSEQIVSGDIILLEAGDRLPADIRLLECFGLMTDESVLTGESLAVSKKTDRLKSVSLEMFEANNIGFAGTIVTAGRGEGVVFATASSTALGDISTLVTEAKHETGFERNIASFSRFIVKFVVITLVLVFVANIFIKGDAVNIPELLIFSLVLAVSVIPEALPAIVTIALSRGALRLAKKKVIIKRLSAIEDLGSIEILCTDKTGTLTENILSVSEVLSLDVPKCLRLASLSSLETPASDQVFHDAFDIALWKHLPAKEKSIIASVKRIDTIPFDPERRRNSVLIQEENKEREIIVRGAPEEVLRLSKNIDAFTGEKYFKWMEERGRKGERVLAVARRSFPLQGKYTLYEEQQLECIGLISFVDPLKATTKETLKKAKALQVQVKILTGDSKEVAGAVGYAVGLISHKEDVVTGKEFAEMNYEEKRKAVFSSSVFARISPREKYEIIKILEEKYEVGFLGEGINDAPALKIADVGLVVSGASDVARGTADVILLEKSLETVIDGIKEGRIIFANILKYLKITLTSNFGNFYSVALASLFLPFVPLLPVQILLLDLLSDFPMVAIATDTVDTRDLKQPKNYRVHSVILMATIFGVVSSVFDFILFGKFFKSDPAMLQTAWFLLSIATEVILIFSFRTYLPFFRSRRIPSLLLLLSVGVVCFSFILPFSSFGQAVFLFVRPTLQMMQTVVFLIIGYFVMTEIVKHFYEEHFHTSERKSIRFNHKRQFSQ